MILPAVSVVFAGIASAKFHRTTNKAHTPLVVFFISITQMTIYFYELQSETPSDPTPSQNNGISTEIEGGSNFD